MEAGWPPRLPRERLRRAPPLQLLYLAILGVPMVAVSALVTLSDHPLWAYYAAALRLWGISALDDQRSGGILMWGPAHVALVWPFTVVFFRWTKRELADEDAGEP